MRSYRKGSAAIVAGIALAIGVALSGSTVLAKPKCPKECKQEFAKNDKSCKADCKTAPKSDKKACRKACASTLKDEKAKCKAATAPVFPTCSPSSAFLD